MKKKHDSYAVYWDKTQYWSKVVEVFQDIEGFLQNKVEIIIFLFHFTLFLFFIFCVGKNC